MKEQLYTIPLMDAFREKDECPSGLNNMARVYSKAIKKELISGINYMPKILYKAQELMYKYNYGGDSLNIPEICWEEAYDSILSDLELS